MPKQTVGSVVVQYLIQEKLLVRLVPTTDTTELIGLITCNDERTFWEKSQFVQDLNGRQVVPLPFLGGAIRFSGRCPGYADGGWRTWALSEVREAMFLRPFSVLGVGVHGEECGKANSLCIGVAQRIWLALDARREIEQAAQRDQWTPTGKFGLFSCYHHRGQDETGQEKQKTWLIQKNHPLVRRLPINQLMCMNDNEFLKKLAPRLLSQLV